MRQMVKTETMLNYLEDHMKENHFFNFSWWNEFNLNFIKYIVCDQHQRQQGEYWIKMYLTTLLFLYNV